MGAMIGTSAMLKPYKISSGIMKSEKVTPWQTHIATVKTWGAIEQEGMKSYVLKIMKDNET